MNSYYLGWVHSIVYADALNTTEDVLHVYCWTGKVKENKLGCYYPSMFDVHEPEEWLDHVTLKK